MQLIDKILNDEDELLIRDRYNRKRLIVQRKWVLAFYFLAYLLISDRLNLDRTIGPIDFSNFTDEALANVFLLANFLIFLFSLIQLPSFAANYPDYLRDTFATMRANESIEDRDTQEKLRQEHTDTLNRIEDLETKQLELTSAQSEYIHVIGEHEPLDIDHEQKARAIAEKFGLEYRPTMLQTIFREQRSLERETQRLIESAHKIQENIQYLNERMEVGLSERTKRFRIYAGTEILTDMTRILPTIIFSTLSTLSLFGFSF